MISAPLAINNGDRRTALLVQPELRVALAIWLQTLRNWMMKSLIFAIGILATLIGLVWIGQGSGYFPYPASSFMISQKPWLYYGAGLALVGLIMIGVGRSKR